LEFEGKMTSQQDQHEAFCSLYREWRQFIANGALKNSISDIVHTICSNLFINAFLHRPTAMKEMLKRIDEITSMPYEDISTVFGTDIYSNYEEATKALNKLASLCTRPPK